MNKRLINNLKQLRDITPSNEWKDNLGTELTSMIRTRFPAREKAGFLVLIKTYFKFHRVVRMGVIVCLVLGVVFGGSIFTVSAARNSLPGDLLYNVKIAKEKVHIAITPQPEVKVKLKLSFAENRLKEANELVNKIKDKDGQKIAQTMENFQKEIEEAEKYLAELKKKAKEEEKVKIKETVKEINLKTKKYEVVLTQLKEKPFLEEDVVDKVDTALFSNRKLAMVAKKVETKPVSVEIGKDKEELTEESIKNEDEGVEVDEPENIENEPIIIEESKENEKKDKETVEPVDDLVTGNSKDTPITPEPNHAEKENEKVKEEENIQPDFQGGIKKEKTEFKGLIIKEKGTK